MLNVFGTRARGQSEEPLTQTYQSPERKSITDRNSQKITTLLRDHHLPISSIPTNKGYGLNYTFVSGALRKKPTYLPKILYSNPEVQVQRARPKYVRSPFHHTPDSLKNRSLDDVVLTIDTRIDSSNEPDIYQFSYKRSFLNEVSSFAKGSASRMLYTHADSETDESEYYDKDAIPGPGAYYWEQGMLDKKRHSLFMSKASRFKYPKKEIDKEQNAQNKKNSIKINDKLRPVPYKKSYPFESSQPRIIEEKVEYVPGPAHYRNRQTMEEYLVRKIQRDFKGKFGREEERFKELKKDDEPGPGHYTIERSEELIPTANFISEMKRQLFNKPQRVPGVGTYNVDTIKVRLYEDPPNERPFGSKAARFVYLPAIEKKSDRYRTIADIVGGPTLFELYHDRPREYINRAISEVHNRSSFN